MNDGRQISREVLEHLRMRSIELWKRGKSVSDICGSFGVKKSAVYNWISSYKRGGKDLLKRKKHPGPAPKLSGKERKKLLGMLEKGSEFYGFESPLWDCRKIQQLIAEKFKKNIHISNIWRFLKRNNLTAKKPQRVASQKDEVEVEDWIKNVWPKIKAHARRWQAIIYFQDESSVQLTAFLGKTWSPKGMTPKIKSTGNRGSVCVTSAISPGGRMVFRLEKKRVNAEKHIEFLKQILRRHSNRKIIVIEDKAPAHTAKKVKQFIEQNKNKLARYHLPSYSPELNPDEHVWAYLKAVKLKTHKAKSIKDFKPLVLSKMKSIQRKPLLIISFFYGPLFH